MKLADILARCSSHPQGIFVYFMQTIIRDLQLLLEKEHLWTMIIIIIVFNFMP